MVKCTKCGADNPLGRVFCQACGSKLDLSAMTSESVAERPADADVLARHGDLHVHLVAERPFA